MTLLNAAPDLSLLVTTQTPLKVAAEHVFRLEALAVPPGPLPAAQAKAYGAVALFVDRAQAIDAHFQLTDANAPAVISLCRSLDGLALAIELAAARAPTLGVRGLADAMLDRLQLLTRNRNREAPQRQRTLRAALEWSVGLLSPAEEAVFRRLAVVAGSASLDLVLRIAADSDSRCAIDKWSVLDALDALVDRSLVVVQGGDGIEPPRYRLLESPRAFALARLIAAGEHDAVRARHARALGEQFDTAWDDLFAGTVGSDAWRARLAPDFDNAREALAWADGHGVAATALMIASTLVTALPFGLKPERRSLTDLCERQFDKPAPDHLRARPFLLWARAVPDRGRRERYCRIAQTMLERARDRSRRVGDQQLLYLGLTVAAHAAVWRRDRDAAQAAVLEMKALEDSGWSAHCLACGASAYSNVATLFGDAKVQLEAGRRWLALTLAAGGSGFVQRVSLIDWEIAAGETAQAVANGRTLVAELASGRDECNLAYARLNLCSALLAQGDHAQAQGVALAGWPQAARFEMQAYWADYLALLAALDGRLREAARLAGYSTARYGRNDDRRAPNEVAAWDQACALARTALSAREFDDLYGEGAALGDADVAALAFGAEVARGVHCWPERRRRYRG
jgi:predicted ATPase